MAKITKSQLVKLQQKYKQDAAIGAQFGITRQAVHQLRKKYGIESLIEDNPKRNKDIISNYSTGKPVSVIAKKNDLSISYTYRILSEAKPKKKARKR
jgi:hypothetical protein